MSAISDEDRWYDAVDGPISAIVVPTLLFLAGLGRTTWYYLFILFRMSISRRLVIIVERDGHVIERREVVGWSESARLIRQLRSQHMSIDR